MTEQCWTCYNDGPLTGHKWGPVGPTTNSGDKTYWYHIWGIEIHLWAILTFTGSQISDPSPCPRIADDLIYRSEPKSVDKLLSGFVWTCLNTLGKTCVFFLGYFLIILHSQTHRGREVAPPLEFRCSWLTTGPRGQRWGEMGHSRDGGSAKETTEVDEAGPGFHSLRHLKKTRSTGGPRSEPLCTGSCRMLVMIIMTRLQFSYYRYYSQVMIIGP